MDSFSVWYSPLPMAQYWGSANAGLGFFHLEVERPEAAKWLNFDNVGVVTIMEGEVTDKELENNFNEMWKINWYWQIRRLASNKFLVRLPPSIKIEDLVEYPSINLKKKGVCVSFAKWNGEEEPFADLSEVWINVEGLQTKWCTWKTIFQVASSLGVLINIDWHTIFRNFYRTVRIKVCMRDVDKIPKDRVYEIEQQLYLVFFDVDNAHVDMEEGDDGSGGNGPEGPNDKDLCDDFREKLEKDASSKDMDMGKDSSTPAAPKNGSTRGVKDSKCWKCRHNYPEQKSGKKRDV
uniref:Uncharacterized protein n=1 Tax=Avena sativa TaxID=4498 RepID=A0ACD5XSK5_AVESA